MDELSLGQKVKYYDSSDLSFSWHIEPVCRFLDEFDFNTNHNCNDMIGLQNCLKYLEDAIFIKTLPEVKQTQYLKMIKTIKQALGRYWANIDSEDKINGITGVEYSFHEDLVAALVDYNLCKKLSNKELMMMLNNNHVHLFTMLANKKLTKILDVELRDTILGNTLEGAECILDAKLLGERARKIYLPDSLTGSDIDKVINAYLDEECANYNYLPLIVQANPSVGISNKTRLKAKRRHEEENKRIFQDQNSGVRYGVEIIFSKDQEPPLDICRRGDIISYSISTNYLDKRLDYESILINASGIFGMAEFGATLTLPSYPSEMSTLESALMVKGKDDYPIGAAFTMKQQRIMGTISIYEQYLASKNISIEDVIQWFFGHHLKEVFNAPSFSYTPSSSQTYYEKAKNLFSEMEGVMRQFRLYTENGIIDAELLELSSMPITYGDLPSLNHGKYVCINDGSEEMKTIMRLVFSDQSCLNYINQAYRGKNLFELLSKYELKLTDFLGYQKPAIEHLLKNDILIQDNDGNIGFSNTDTLAVLNILDRVGAIVYSRCIDSTKTKLNEMLSKKWLISKDTLLTPHEADYFDYCLNRRQFSNSLDLRNKYLHGANSHTQDEDAHRAAYLQGIILMLALAIKVRDDFVLWAYSKENE